MTAVVFDLLRSDPAFGTAGVAIVLLLALRLKGVRYGRSAEAAPNHRPTTPRTTFDPPGSPTALPQDLQAAAPSGLSTGRRLTRRYLKVYGKSLGFSKKSLQKFLRLNTEHLRPK